MQRPLKTSLLPNALLSLLSHTTQDNLPRLTPLPSLPQKSLIKASQSCLQVNLMDAIPEVSPSPGCSGLRQVDKQSAQRLLRKGPALVYGKHTILPSILTLISSSPIFYDLFLLFLIMCICACVGTVHIAAGAYRGQRHRAPRDTYRQL